ncbi:Calexcitin-2 [Melipona quadrifasciata]|uniref:Calexcitin-2 n=1 Tax=Melipona quadrifasciata TaxID=166423 RepID=A0A0N0U6L9_9HYME|nr:Calexcitin-2 [Melipona quadrifasciata]
MTAEAIRVYSEAKVRIDKMPLSEFRKKKLLYVFNTFFESKPSVTIKYSVWIAEYRNSRKFEQWTRSDNQSSTRINENRGWSADNPKAQSIRDTLLKMWDNLRQGADTDQDGQVSRDEWFELWEEYAKNPSNASEWQQDYMSVTFQLFDASGDKSIDENEYCNVCRYHGVAEAEAREAFKKLGVGQEITWDKFTNLWKQYFSSDEPTAAGNFIFGKTSF